LTLLVAANAAGRAALGVVLLIVFVIYFIPTAIAIIRKNRQTPAVIAVNFFLGWTLLGWVGALVWALAGPQESASRPGMQPPAGYPQPQVSPGWYPDQTGRLRYWSGWAWTEHVQ
jgi:hypothetical protein